MEEERKVKNKTFYILGIIFLVLIVAFNVKKSSERNLEKPCTKIEKDKVFEEEKRFTKEDLQHLRERAKTKNGKYTGVGKGKNLIVIQAESLQDFVIGRKYDGQEITPNLNKLAYDEPGLYFNNYYQIIGRSKTADAEFASHNSLYPSMEDLTYGLFQENTFYGLPWILRDNGYTAWAFHGYEKEFWNRDKAYPNQGFERYVNEENFEVGETIGFGMVDEDFFEQSIPYIKEMGEPFYAFMITLTNHIPFEMPQEHEKIKLREEHVDTILGNYLQSVYYMDEQIGKFIEDLKEEGLYDDTIICIYGDHFGIHTQDEENVRLMSDFLGYTYDFDQMMRIPLIVHIPGSDIKEEISNVGSQLDFLPTMLNIMGLENEKGVMFGVDIVNSKEGFAPQQMYAMKGSYIDNEKMFVMSRDGIYDNSRAFYLDTKEPVDLKECRAGYERAIRELDKCVFFLENDLMKDILNGKEDFSDIKVETLDIKNDDFAAIAGGGVQNIPFSNSKEALEESYKKGFRLIEVDLQWTSDDELVLLHDWDKSLEKLFSMSPGVYSHDKFMSFDMTRGLHQMDLEDLANWMENHKDAYIITDIRDENPRALRYIAKTYPDIKDRIIPQIYCMDEYHPVKVPKYKNIILNLELSDYTDEQIIDFVKLREHFAVVLPKSRGEGGLPEKLAKLKVPTYVYGVNKGRLKRELEENYVYGVYTEKLNP